MSREKNPIDAFFDMADRVMDTAEDVAEGLDEDDRPRRASPPPKGYRVPEGRVIEASSAELATTRQARPYFVALVMPDRQWHGFQRPDTPPPSGLVSVCGVTSKAEDVIAHRRLDSKDRQCLVMCFSCLSHMVEGR